MTPAQNRIIGFLSALSTIAVLVAGGSGPGLDAKVLSALAKQRTYDTVGATFDASSDDGGFDDSGGGGGSSGGGGGTVGGGGGGTVGSAGGGGGSDEVTPPPEEEPEPSKIEHVFVIALAGQGFDATFGAGSKATYLSQELVPKGALLTEYRSLGTADLPDYIAMIGGQPPNADTEAGCPAYKEIPFDAAPSKTGEIKARGCVYPNTVATVADQFDASGRVWRAYLEDVDKGPNGVAATCRRPESNAPDDTLKGRVGDGYATRHNPFVYFHSLLDLGGCDASSKPLAELETDLGSVRTTPSFSFIAPNVCNDGTESPCADGSPGGLAAADAFLAQWVPKILAAPAFDDKGLLIVTFAGNVAATAPDAGAAEGHRNGTLLISPFAKAGSTVGAEYDPYSLLRSVQDLFALRPLARSNGATSFADTVLADALVTPPSDD